MKEDPPRLFEGDPSSDLARALRAARADVLSPDAVARVRAGVVTASAAAATAPAATSATSAAAKGASSGLVFKASVAIVLLGAALGAYGLSRGAAPAESPLSRTVVSGAPVVTTAPELAPAPASEPARPSEPANATPPEATPKVAARPVARPAPQPSADAVTREGAILLEARRVMDSDPARALTLVRKCESEFPDSQLAPERARLAAQAKQRLSP